MPTFYDTMLCQGVDLFTFLQGRNFSLFGLFDQSLGPLSSNVLIWIIYGFIGYHLMRHLLVQECCSKLNSSIIGLVWVSGSFFSLRFFSGEIGMAGLLLTPGLLLWKHYSKSKQFYLLSLIICIQLVLEGSFPVLQLFFYGLLFFVLFDLIPLEVLRNACVVFKQNRLFFCLGFVSVICILCFKIYPWATLTSDQIRIMESVRLPWQQILYSFFSPFQSAESLSQFAPNIPHPYIKSFPLSFVEVGCYFGGLKLILAFIGLRKQVLWKNYILFFVFLFWTAWGVGDDINFWSFHQNLPVQFILFQSHFLVLVYCVFLLLVAKALSNISSKKLLYTIVFLLLCEGVITALSPMRNLKHGFNVLLAAHQRSDFTVLLKNQDPAVKTMDVCFLNKKSGLIPRENRGTEPFVSILDKGALGHVDLRSNTSSGDLTMFIQLNQPGNVGLNLNWALGWVTDRGEVYPQKNGRVGIYFGEPFQGEVRARYEPPYRIWIYIIWLIGLILLIMVIRNCLFRPKGQDQSKQDE